MPASKSVEFRRILRHARGVDYDAAGAESQLVDLINRLRPGESIPDDDDKVVILAAYHLAHEALIVDVLDGKIQIDDIERAAIEKLRRWARTKLARPS